MKTKILKYVSEHDGCSFVDLSKAIDGFRGNLEFVRSEVSPLIIWHAVSSSAHSALNQLLDERKLHLHPATALGYQLDGEAPPFKGGEGDKEDFWMPALLSTYPFIPTSE